MARAEDPAGRERILRAATELFYVNGVRAVGTADVIAAAGCGKNMLYRHFPGKAALAAAYLRGVRAERDKATATALAAHRAVGSAAVNAGAGAGGAGAGAGELVALVGEVAAWVSRADFRGCAFRNYLTEFPGADDEPAHVAQAYLRDTRRQVDDLVAGLGAPAVTADRIWLLIDALYAGTGTPPRVAVDWASELVG
ncbi:TetR/AcrR family transcriptional regulator [Actinoplanes sp. NPDC051513]|uniref:TetR/AcrR family transcriptional regulator n=1 Tax=Actinoplanes sp. NPDC051513 TaxID=3363908 RepID=UPI0037A5D945